MPRSRSEVGILVLAASLAGCSPGVVSHGPRAVAAAPAPLSPPSSRSDETLQASTLEAEGVLDGAADHRRRAYEKAPSAERKLAWGRALAASWAFERARSVLREVQEDAGAPSDVRAAAGTTLASLPPDEGPNGGAAPPPDVLAVAFHALAARDGRTARAALAPLDLPGASPVVLELVGRAHAALGERVEARQAWARARSRLDARGARLSLEATSAEAASGMVWHDGLLWLARRRDRRPVDGYTSSDVASFWIEAMAPGEREPLVRWPVGIIDGLSTSADGRTLALVETPPAPVGSPVAPRARLLGAFDDRTLASWPSGGFRSPLLLPPGDAVAAMGTRSVVRWDRAGRTADEYPVSGTTQGMIYAYGPNGCVAVPTTAQSAPEVMALGTDGSVAVGASDGALWVWPRGKGTPLHLLPYSRPPKTFDEARKLTPLAVHLDTASRTAVVAQADGSLQQWDLATRRRRTLAEGRCTPGELSQALLQPGSAEECAATQLASVSPDGSRFVLAGSMHGVRVRDGRTGGPIAFLPILSPERVAFLDDPGTQAWFAWSDGSVRQVDTGTGTTARGLPQGGVGGFVRGLSADGRFLAVQAPAGAGRELEEPPLAQIWDTVERRAVGAFAGLVPVQFASASPVMVAVARGQGASVWDLALGRRLLSLDRDEGSPRLSANGERIVSLRTASGAGTHDRLVVRDPGRPVREIDLGESGTEGFALDRDGHTAASFVGGGGFAIWNLDDGTPRHRTLASDLHGVQLSPGGQRVCWNAWIGNASVVVVASAVDGTEVARLSAKDVAPALASDPMRACTFVTDDELLVVGPGAPGYAQVYRWSSVGTAAQRNVTPTELRVLMGETIEVAPAGVARIYDQNDAVHLLRVADGTVLASAYATQGAGWVAQSRDGAVDGSEEGRSALVTTVVGKTGDDVVIGGSASLAWDRFVVPGVLARAAAGERVAAP